MNSHFQEKKLNEELFLSSKKKYPKPISVIILDIIGLFGFRNL